MLDILFPPYCLNCNKYGEYLCNTCRKLLKSNLPECYMCRKISNGYVTHKECNIHNISKFFIGWEYSTISKRILSNYKYRYAFELSKIIGDMLIDRLDRTGFSKNISPNSILIPMPIHSSHSKERGFNQVSLIAKHLSIYYKCEYNDTIVQRVKGREYQSKKRIKERKEIDSSYFQMNDILGGRDIIILDDVISTGNTINSLADLFIDNNVIAIALFRGSPQYRYLRK